MIAFKMKIADAYRGITVQIYLVVELTNEVIQRAKVEEPVGVHYNINDIRRLPKTSMGIKGSRAWSGS